jgi:hypothetical protein
MLSGCIAIALSYWLGAVTADLIGLVPWLEQLHTPQFDTLFLLSHARHSGAKPSIRS